MLGQDTFLASIQNFLRAKAFSTATKEDLWTHMEFGAQQSCVFANMTPLSIKEVMDH